MAGMIDLLLPRFVQESKKYAAITIGCTGGRHRSVYLVEKLADHLADRIAAARTSGGLGWRLHVTHRELAREGLEAAYLTDRPVPRTGKASEFCGAAAIAAPVQAQEA
jgi:RNase adapter protein RapZ